MSHQNTANGGNPLSSLPPSTDDAESIAESSESNTMRRRGFKAKLKLLKETSASSLKAVKKATKKRMVWDEFKDFLIRGNIIAIGIGFVMGQQFQGLVVAFTASFITPLLAATSGHAHFSNMSFQINNSRFEYGNFINAILAFMITSVLLFYLMVKPLQRMKLYGKDELDVGPPREVNARRCPYCYEIVPKIATKCKSCTSSLIPIMDSISDDAQDLESGNGGGADYSQVTVGTANPLTALAISTTSSGGADSGRGRKGPVESGMMPES